MAKQMKVEAGKFIKHFMEGHLYYPSLNSPNTKFKPEGIYETFLVPIDKSEIAEAKAFEGNGPKIKEWENNGIPEAIHFKQYTRRKDGTDNPKPPVRDAEGNPFNFTKDGRDIKIGNGTRAKIQYYIYEIKNAYGQFTSYMISAVKILDLVEFEPEAQQDPTEISEENLDF